MLACGGVRVRGRGCARGARGDGCGARGDGCGAGGDGGWGGRAHLFSVVQALVVVVLLRGAAPAALGARVGRVDGVARKEVLPVREALRRVSSGGGGGARARRRPRTLLTPGHGVASAFRVRARWGRGGGTAVEAVSGGHGMCVSWVGWGVAGGGGVFGGVGDGGRSDVQSVAWAGSRPRDAIDKIGGARASAA